MDCYVLRQKERFQVSYELPHQAYNSHVYPRQSSNGSTVVVYGHEHGLRIVWYAGRRFKPKKESSASKVNGTSNNDPMVIDLDDDDNEPATTETAATPAEFEEEDEEVDHQAPYRDVLRHVDIPLGTAATRITMPHFPKDISEAPAGAWPAIYNSRVVIAAACSDLTLRIIAVPIDPPSPEVQDVHKMEIQVMKIGGTNSHQQFISDIAITHTARQSGKEESSQPRERSQSRPTEGIAEGEIRQWSLLVASISCTGTGLLLIHQIPLQGTQMSASADVPIPIRRTCLRTASMGARLSFNTAASPSERHSTLLITLPSDTTVKVYQVYQQPHSTERRGSNATTDSVSTTKSTRILSGDRGRFLITLLPSFAQGDNPVGSRGKQVLDAKWIAGGRAVLALLEDGEWGIWDLEAAGPTSSSSGVNLIRGQGNISGIHGGSLTRFAIRSSISSSATTRPTSSHSQLQPISGSLAPMTPSTRKARSSGLFQGPKPEANAATLVKQPRGSIYVEEAPASRPAHDESVIISYGDENIYLPSVLAFWKGVSKPLRLPNVNTGGQMPRSISLLPITSPEIPKVATGLYDSSSAAPDFVIQTSLRLVFSLMPLSVTPISASAANETARGLSDQTLLVSGDLDVEGMDRLLDDMDGAVASKKPLNLFTKSVGFDIRDEDGDGDIDMATSPTPVRSGLKWAHGRNGFGGETPSAKRRIFS